MNLNDNILSSASDDEFFAMLAGMLGGAPRPEPVVPADDVTAEEKAGLLSIIGEVNNATSMQEIFTVTDKLFDLHKTDRVRESYHYHQYVHAALDVTPAVALLKFGYDAYKEAINNAPDVPSLHG